MIGIDAQLTKLGGSLSKWHSEVKIQLNAVMRILYDMKTNEGWSSITTCTAQRPLILFIAYLYRSVP